MVILGTSETARKRGEYTEENRGKAVRNKTSGSIHHLLVAFEGVGYYHLGVDKIGSGANKRNCQMADKRYWELA